MALLKDVDEVLHLKILEHSWAHTQAQLESVDDPERSGRLRKRPRSKYSKSESSFGFGWDLQKAVRNHTPSFPQVTRRFTQFRAESGDACSEVGPSTCDRSLPASGQRGNQTDLTVPGVWGLDPNQSLPSFEVNDS